MTGAWRRPGGYRGGTPDHRRGLIDRLLPPGVTKRIQVVNLGIGLVGLAIAPFLSLGIAVKVINEVSMWTLVVAGLAGLDSARNPRPGDAE